MKFFMSFLAVCFMASAAFAQAFHMGARVSGNYNMIWNVDHSVSTSNVMANFGILESEMRNATNGVEASVSGLDKLSGLGTSFGLVFMIEPNPFFAIQPELLFSYRARSVTLTANASGYKEREECNYYNGYSCTTRTEYVNQSRELPEIEINQWYLDIPVLFRIQTGTGLFFNIGPVASINMDSELKATIINIDIDDYTTTAVFGLIGGLGYSVYLGGLQRLDIDFRVQMGLTSIISDSIEIEDEGEKITLDATKVFNPKDLIISLGIAYWFI